MERCVIVVYSPKPGKEDLLIAAIRDHLIVLREEKLATERPAFVMRSKSGAYLEVFEWVSVDAIAQAHQNPAVQALWQRFGEACDYQTLSNLDESGQMFAEFESITL